MNKAQDSAIRVGYRGYSTHREFNGNRIPVPVQNLMMREYALQRGLVFKLGVDEFDFPNCYLRLQGVIEELPTLEGIIATSLFILPREREMRLKVYAETLRHGASLHLIMENAIVATPKDIDHVEEIWQISEALKECPRTIPEGLLSYLRGKERFTG